MPSSRPNAIPTVIHLIKQLKPKSILDVGVGFGKWGHLFREYTDILEAERDSQRYDRNHWQVKIDGIEGHAAYLTEMHRYLYNEIHVGDARELIGKLPRYDVIFLGDVIEHFEKEAGRKLLQDAMDHANKAVIVLTPKYETGQGDLCDNELERHRSVWSMRDFRKFDGAIVKTVDRATLLAVFSKPGVPPLLCKPPVPPPADDVKRMLATKEEILRLIPDGEPFILVDEEQIRSELVDARTFPFLEKNGEYWGPPPDGETAIHECERLRGAGAKFIVFAWPTFWWLDYYADFHHYLLNRFRCVWEDDNVKVFALGG